MKSPSLDFCSQWEMSEMQITIAAMQPVRKGLILIFKELKSKKVKSKGGKNKTVSLLSRKDC